jgi:hypothetical protein
MFVEFKNYYLPIKESKQKWILLKTLVGFLNSKGGTIYIGIEDNEGQVVGQEIKRKQRDEFLLFIKTLADKIVPPVDFFNREEVLKISPRSVLSTSPWLPTKCLITNTSSKSLLNRGTHPRHTILVKKLSFPSKAPAKSMKSYMPFTGITWEASFKSEARHFSKKWPGRRLLRMK